MGPLLFSVYINDLPHPLKKCEVDSYVDDTKMYLFFNIKDKDTSVTELQQDLISIRNWGFNNSILINPDKTKLIVFRTKQTLSRLDDFKLSLLGEEVTPYVILEFTWILSCPMTNIFLRQCLPSYLVFVK